jgi:small conductance mechanosensitive channel
VVDVTVAYKEDLDRVFQLLQKVGARLAKDWPDRVTEAPAVLGVEKLAADGVTIRMVARTPPMKQWDVVREWRRRIKDEFDKAGVEVPQRSAILLEPEGEKADRKKRVDDR